MLQACVCKEVSWTPDGSETAAAYVSCSNAQSTTSFSPNPPVIRFPPLPLGHLTLGTGSDNFSDCCRVTGDGGTLVGNSLASAPSEVASQESPVRHTSGKCQPDTMENKKEGLGRAALTPLRAGGIELNGEGGQG